MNAATLRKATKLYQKGYAYRAISDEIRRSTGEDYSWEWYRSQLFAIGVAEPGRVRAARRARERAKLKKAEQAEQRREWRARGLKCAVCGKIVMRDTKHSKGETKTCSPECATVWPKLRYYLDDEARHEQQVRSAKWVLKNRDRVDESQVQHAHNVLKGTAGTHGRWHIKGSKVSKMLKKYRPDLYEKIQ